MKIGDIISWLDSSGYKYRFSGDKECEISGFSSLSHYRAGTFTWIKKSENYDKYLADNENAVIPVFAVIQDGVSVDIPNVIISDNSKQLFFAILHGFWGEDTPAGTVGEGTVIGADVKLDKSATVGCNCTITGDVVIGEDTVIENNVVIQGKVVIGKRCHIQSCAVIGIDGMGYTQDPVTKKKTMIEHFGGVNIGDDVFIGVHVNIDRGTIDDTVIGDGAKIGPSAHIGHNSVIGENTAVICSTVYGSVTTGKGAYISASTVATQMNIGDDTVIGMGSVVTRPVESGVIAYGIPAKKVRDNDSGL